MNDPSGFTHVVENSSRRSSTSTREPCARADTAAETASAAETTGFGFTTAAATTSTAGGAACAIVGTNTAAATTPTTRPSSRADAPSKNQKKPRDDSTQHPHNKTNPTGLTLSPRQDNERTRPTTQSLTQRRYQNSPHTPEGDHRTAGSCSRRAPAAATPPHRHNVDGTVGTAVFRVRAPRSSPNGADAWDKGGR